MLKKGGESKHWMLRRPIIKGKGCLTIQFLPREFAKTKGQKQPSKKQPSKKQPSMKQPSKKQLNLSKVSKMTTNCFDLLKVSKITINFLVCLKSVSNYLLIV